jgi:3-oxoisoapionate decarboxylase
MIVGISSFTYGWSVGVEGNFPLKPLTISGLLRQTINAGLTCVQVGDNLPLHHAAEESLKQIRQLQMEKNIRLEVGAKKLTEVSLEQYIEVCRYFQSPLLRFVVDGDNYKPDRQTVISIIQDALPELRKENLTLGIENHDRFKAKELADIMEAVADNHVGICLDCANSLGAGEGLEYVSEVLAPYTVNLHVKDFSIQRLSHKMGFVVTGAPAGKGMANIPMLLEKLEKHNRCQSVILEQWVPWQGDIQKTIETERSWADEGVSYLKALMALQEK